MGNKAFLYGNGGGGGGLNYKVVGNPQPSNPKGNIIWIDTDVKIPAHYLSAEQPENMQPGEVWISAGTSSPVAFNVAKKDVVMVYPISAKQMQEDGTLADVTAKSWQDGEWVDWIPLGTLFYRGDQRTEITGGWTSDGYADNGNYNEVAAIIGDTIKAEVTFGSGVCIVGTRQLIPLADYKTLRFNVLACDGAQVYAGIGKSKTVGLGSGDASITISATGEQAIDVSSLNESYYVFFSVWGQSADPTRSVEIDSVVLE